MLRWFGHVERMSESGLSQHIYNAGRGCPRKTNIDLIGEVLKKSQVCSTRNRCGFMMRCMNMDEARGACKES